MANATDTIVLGAGIGEFMLARWLKTPSGKVPAPPLALAPRPAPPDFAARVLADCRRLGVRSVIVGGKLVEVE